MDQQNGFGAAFLESLLGLVNGTAEPNAQPDKGVINLISLLVLVSDWSIIMISPWDLLLVVSHLFAIPILVLWVGLEKSKTWMREKKNSRVCPILTLQNICDSANIFLTPKFSYLFFSNNTHKTKTGNANRWEITNSKPPVRERKTHNKRIGLFKKRIIK
jgi:hypothetical protein